MGAKKHAALPAKVKAVQARMEHWRSNRQKRERIPESLWEAAVSVARVYGVYVTAKALRMNYGALRERMGRWAAGGVKDKGNSIGFVELDGRQLIGSPEPTATVVELADADGRKVRIQLSGWGHVDVLSLANSFWGRRI